MRFDEGSPEAVADAVWQWRFSFESHWGQHATGAMNALRELVSD